MRRRLKSTELSKRETVAFGEFNKVLKGRVEGKPDNVGTVWHDPEAEVAE